MNDAELIKRIKSGDMQAFEVLVKRYEKKLINFAKRYSEQDSQDIAQETFIKLYKNIDKIDPTRKFSTYMFEIAKNQAISILRKNKREVPLFDTLEDSAEPKFEFDIKSWLSNLEKKYRQVISLYYIEDLSYAQVAQKMAIPINTVRTYLHRAKAALKKEHGQ